LRQRRHGQRKPRERAQSSDEVPQAAGHFSGGRIGEQMRARRALLQALPLAADIRLVQQLDEEG
jgi:hypothetical protein